jgi:transposase-like protein
LNNTIEQDHRGMKTRTGQMLGFKKFKTEAITLVGIELMRRIYKRQFDVSGLPLNGNTAPEISNALLGG